MKIKDKCNAGIDKEKKIYYVMTNDSIHMSYICFHLLPLGFHVNMMLYKCQIKCNCQNILVFALKHYQSVSENQIKSNQIYISPADTMSYLGLMQHAIIYCTNKILMNYGDL